MNDEMSTLVLNQHRNISHIQFVVCFLLLGGEIVSTFDNPEGVKLGECSSIEEVMIGEDKLLKFSGIGHAI